MKRKIALLFALIALLALMLCGSALAATYSGTCGENLTWTLEDNGVLTISGEGKMADYYNPDYAPWYSYRDLINFAVIDDGVTYIGNCAFYGCSSLTSIDIPDSVYYIDDAVFSGCSSLTSIDIPDNVRSIGGSTFSGCSSLTSINIPDGVWSIDSYTFSGCSSLTSINIPDGVTYIFNNAFSGCSSLTSIVIPNSVTYIGDHAFSGCSGLTDLVISHGVTSIGRYTFSGCTDLTSIVIPGSVTSIGDSAFSDCTGLTNVVISDGVTSIDRLAFSDCTGLTSIVIPNSVTSIGEYAFNECTKLKSIVMGDNVTSIGKNFVYRCFGLTFYCRAGSSSATALGEAQYSFVDTDYPDFSLRQYTNDNGETYLSFMKYSGSATKLTIPESLNGIALTTINSYAFSYCSSLTSIVIPDSVTSIGDNAFDYCSSLEKVTFLGEDVPEIGYEAIPTTAVIVCHKDSEVETWARKNDYEVEYIDGGEPETISISGSIIWDDNNDQDGMRPESVTVRLLADGEIIDVMAVTVEHGWMWSFDNLPKYRDGGEEIVYTIIEDDVYDYTTYYNGYDIFNSHIPEIVTIEGSIIWDDNDDQDGMRPEAVTINLYADYEIVESMVVT